MEDFKLIASAPSIANLQKLINDFYFSDMYTIEQPTDKRFELWHTTRGYRSFAKIIKQGKRYKFYIPD